jgi:hypothetical protein
MSRHRSIVVPSAGLGIALLCAAPSLVAARQGKGPLQASSLQKASRAVSGSVAVKSLALEGSRSTAVELMMVPPAAPSGRAELLFLLPDQYRQTLVNPSMMSYLGFSRGVPLLGAKALQANTHVDAGTPAADFVDTQRVIAARLAFGILGHADGIMHVTATPAGAGTWHLLGGGGFDCLVDLDPATAVPLRVRYTDMGRLSAALRSRGKAMAFGSARARRGDHHVRGPAPDRRSPPSFPHHDDGSRFEHGPKEHPRGDSVRACAGQPSVDAGGLLSRAVGTWID